MTTTKQIFTGDPSQLNQCYKDLAQQVTRLEDRIHKLTTASTDGTTRSAQQHDMLTRVLRSQISTVANLALSWVSVQSVVQAVNYDLEKTLELQGKAASTQVSMAEAQANVLLNTFGASSEERRRILARAEQIAAQTGMQPELVTNVAGAVMGTGSGTTDQRLSSLDIAAQISKRRPEMLEPTAVAIGQVQKIAGVGPEEAAGLMLSGGASAFVSNPAGQARFLQQAMSGVVASSPGDQKRAAEQGVEMGAAFTQMVGEERGESARTHAISLASQMDKFFREGVELGSGPLKFRRKPKVDPELPIDRLRYLQEHPEEAKAFLSKATFERLFDSSTRNLLLKPGGKEAGMLRDAEQAVTYDAAGVRETIRMMSEGTRPLKLADTAGKSETQATLHLASKDEASLRAEIEKTLRKALEQTSDDAGTFGSLDTWFRLKGAQLMGDNYGRPLPDVMTEDSPGPDPRRMLVGTAGRKSQIEARFQGREMPEDARESIRYLEEQARHLDTLIRDLNELRRTSDQQNATGQAQLEELKRMNSTMRELRVQGYSPAEARERGGHRER